ncbi:hypothetical protein [Tsukamurella pulmonis]|uniref:hypothetical protein n=1 Tax=Tsukamurella pulmonis TaxID=47312 RepID=UPI001EDF8A8F|nr:hypothetical protein [Tsukamurella pulmonis]
MTSQAPSSTNGTGPFRDPTPAPPLAAAAHGYTITAITEPANEPGRVVTTPQLAEGDPAVTARFNAAMRASMANMPQNTPDTDADDTTLSGGYGTGVTKIGSGVVAGRIVLLWYGRGAAHPNRSLGTVVIATATAQPITVDNLYRDPTAARAHLRTLVPSLDPSLRLRHETLEYETFTNWLPTPTGLEVYVSVPHIAGDFVPVIVPWERFADQLKPGVEQMLRAD